MKQFAENSQIPVVTTLLGLSAMRSDHVLNLGLPGMHGSAFANMAIDDADLIIAIGMRFDDRVTGNLKTFATKAKIIHIDIDPSEIGKNILPEIAIIGDAGAVLRQLLELNLKKTHPKWIQKIDQLRKTHPFSYPNTNRLLPQFIVEEISRITKGQSIVVTGVGQHQMWAAQLYEFKENNLWISSGGVGAMGFEVPAALGAQIGRPEKVVWAIAGDGGFQMTLTELATMVEAKAPVKIALINNFSLGMVRQWQELFYEKDYFATLYSGNPDWVKLAEAYGITGLKVTKKDEVEIAIKLAMDTPGPALVDFQVDQEENVYPFIPPGGGVKEIQLYPAEKVVNDVSS